MIESKRCPSCADVKPRDGFSRNRANKDGLHSYCKPCHVKRVAKSKRNSPGEAARLRRYYETPHGRALVLRQAAKQRRGGEVFRAEWLADKIAAGRCEVTGIEFDLRKPVRGHQNPLAPSIDRIDSSLGYQESNVQVVIFAFNSFKGEMPAEEAKALLKRMALAL